MKACSNLSDAGNEALNKISEIANTYFDQKLVNEKLKLNWNENEYWAWVYGKFVDILTYPNWYRNYKSRFVREGKLKE